MAKASKPAVKPAAVETKKPATKAAAKPATKATAKPATKAAASTKPTAKPKVKPQPAPAIISAWEQDPGAGSHPDGGQLVQQPAPVLSSTTLPTSIEHPTAVPPAKIYPPGTPEFRYWAAADALNRGSVFWSSHLPGTSWQVGKTLPVDLDHGNDLNAYYDRVGLRFFHGRVSSRTVYSCESPDVVCHEQGHAILDAIKPQLWDAAYLEAGAFHESFGDMSAILVGLQLQSLRNGVLAETGGTIYRASRLSRLAEQLGWAIRQSSPDAVDADCLRSAVNSFFYRDPNKLPSAGPANVLSSEPHSFSRVFTGAFFEGLGGMFKLQAAQDEKSLLQVSQDMAQILLAGINGASVVPAFYSQVAHKMVEVANAGFAKIGYGQAIRSAFIRHGILSPSTPVAVAPKPANVMMMMASPAEAKDLPQSSINIAEYGLGMDSIMVHTASEQVPSKMFSISSAAPGTGSVEPTSGENAAKTFIEHLLRRGRVKVMKQQAKGMAMAVTRANEPDTHPTHTHEIRLEDNAYVLRRVRIDCGLNH